MKSVVFDTNVLLDLFVFNDFRAIHLKAALCDRTLSAFATLKTIEEFADVITRPLFYLEATQQEEILDQWRSLAQLIDDQTLLKAPWQCQDPDDQVFLDLAFTVKPCLLFSKDNEVLKLANRAAKAGILVTANYNALAQ